MAAIDPIPSPVLAEDYAFLVTDETDVEHDVGPLVNEVLGLRRTRANSVQEEDDRDPWMDHASVASGSPALLSAVELGIVCAVGTLFGEEAKRAFVAHCNEVERFLQETDTERH